MPLTINNEKVARISGPVSMYILYPGKCLDSYPKAPIFILFGDVHFSNTGYCSYEKKDFHFNVFDDDFLHLFSEAVDEGVDFYLEAGGKNHDFSKKNDLPTYQASGRVGPMYELWKLFRNCYINPKMKDRNISDNNKFTCGKIPNIRWQSSDIRCFGDYSGLEAISVEFDNLIRTQHRYTIDELMVEFQRIIKINEDYFNSYKDTILLTTVEFIDNYLRNDKSLIVKQLNKIMNMEKRKKLITSFEEYINMEYDKVEEKQLKDFMSLKDAMIKMGKYDNKDEYGIAYEYVKNAFSTGLFKQYHEWNIAKFTIVPDLYILARSHKNMEKTKDDIKKDDKSDDDLKYPLINIIYYGNYHVQNLAICLEKIGYVCIRKMGILNSDYSNIKRCINVLGDVNMDVLINVLKNFRSGKIQSDAINKILNKILQPDIIISDIISEFTNLISTPNPSNAI